jgi:hypothetical protein
MSVIILIMLGAFIFFGIIAGVVISLHKEEK